MRLESTLLTMTGDLERTQRLSVCYVCLSYVHAVTIYYGWRETRALDTTCAPVCGARDEDAHQRVYMRIIQSVKISKDIIKLSFVYLCTCSRHRCRVHKQHQTRCNLASVARERRDKQENAHSVIGFRHVISRCHRSASQGTNKWSGIASNHASFSYL